MLTEIFVASIGRVPKGVRLTTMVPAPGDERMCYELCVSLADNGTTVVIDGSVEVRWIWKADYDANRGRCNVDATLAVEETLPTRGPRHEVDVFHWCDTTEARKDHHQLRKGSPRRLGFRRFCRPKLQKRDLRTMSHGVAVCSQVLIHEGYVFLLTNSTERAPA